MKIMIKFICLGICLICFIIQIVLFIREIMNHKRLRKELYLELIKDIKNKEENAMYEDDWA